MDRAFLELPAGSSADLREGCVSVRHRIHAQPEERRGAVREEAEGRSAGTRHPYRPKSRDLTKGQRTAHLPMEYTSRLGIASMNDQFRTATGQHPRGAWLRCGGLNLDHSDAPHILLQRFRGGVLVDGRHGSHALRTATVIGPGCSRLFELYQWYHASWSLSQPWIEVRLVS